MHADTDIRITAEYEQVKELINGATPVTFVTGKAGTGKSTLIHHLRNTVRGNCVVVAPTGVAAMNVQGATIHSFFRFPPRLLTERDVKAVRFKRPYQKLNLVIVDEVSMVRADVLDAIDRFLRRNGPNGDLPFGGIQMVLVGDVHQLPPVVASAEEKAYFNTQYKSPFFFSSHVLREVDSAAVELTHVFRQKESSFIDILNGIRIGSVTPELLDRINARVTARVDPDRETVLSTTNVIADRMNKQRLATLPSPGKVFTGAVEGQFHITSDRLPSPMQLLLKEDARVMFTKNDSEGRWVNGSLGIVQELTDKIVRVRLDGTDDTVQVEKALWETYRYEFDEDEEEHVPVATGSFTQHPLTPAWALTIHKSQGKTLSAVRVDLGRSAFASGQVYVALSRCRRLDDLSLSRPIASRDVFVDERVRQFYDGMFLG